LNGGGEGSRTPVRIVSTRASPGAAHVLKIPSTQRPWAGFGYQ